MGWSPLLWSVGYQLLGSAGALAEETRAPLGSCKGVQDRVWELVLMGWSPLLWSGGY